MRYRHVTAWNLCIFVLRILTKQITDYIPCIQEHEFKQEFRIDHTRVPLTHTFGYDQSVLITKSWEIDLELFRLNFFSTRLERFLDK